MEMDATLFLMEKVGEGETKVAFRRLLETLVHTIVVVPPMEPPSLDTYTLHGILSFCFMLIHIFNSFIATPV